MELEELYQQIILDHSRRPRNYGEMPDADRHVFGDNPMCGDEVTLHVKFGSEDKVEAITFTGSGCAICTASASMLTQQIKNKTRDQAKELAHTFHQMVTGIEAKEADEYPEELGNLRLLQGVRKFPQRVKCATLAWHALDEALED